MTKVESLTKKFELLFRKCYNLDTSEYEKVMFNVQLMKFKYFNPKHKKNSNELFERVSFKDFINSK